MVAFRGQALTIEEQKELMKSVKAAEQTEASKSGAEIGAPSLRNVPLGQDRDGQLYWKLQTSAILTGGYLDF